MFLFINEWLCFSTKGNWKSSKFYNTFPCCKKIKIHQTNKNPNNCKLKGDFVSYSSGKCVLVISAWHYKNEDVVWTVTNNDTSQPHQETWNKGMTMIDGSYSFTDISRKVFAGLAGQSGRTFPAWPAMHHGRWLMECPLQPTACPEGQLLLTEMFGLWFVKEIPKEVPENPILFACVKQETSLANTDVLEGETLNSCTWIKMPGGLWVSCWQCWMVPISLCTVALLPLRSDVCVCSGLCTPAPWTSSPNLLPKPPPQTCSLCGAVDAAGASICLSAAEPRALSSPLHIIAC